MSLVKVMNAGPAQLLADAHGLGFDKCLYVIELLDDHARLPLQAVGTGLTAEHRTEFMKRVPHDPLRRMLARGEIPIGNTPITYENTGKALSIGSDQKMSVTDTLLLRWCLAQGVRTGMNFRIRMSQGRYASVNFYSAGCYGVRDLETAVQALFLIGHRMHAMLEPHIPRGRDNLLSGREMECLEWIASGYSNGQIADLLGLSVDTVKEHIQGLFQKLNVSSRAQAVSRAHILSYLG
jgi:DNA-binding CsgD family transcriptional regulator